MGWFVCVCLIICCVLYEVFGLLSFVWGNYWWFYDCFVWIREGVWGVLWVENVDKIFDLVVDLSFVVSWCEFCCIWIVDFFCFGEYVLFFFIVKRNGWEVFGYGG